MADGSSMQGGAEQGWWSSAAVTIWPPETRQYPAGVPSVAMATVTAQLSVPGHTASLRMAARSAEGSSLSMT